MQKDLNKVINSVRKRTHTHREKFNIFSVSNSILSISSEFTLQSQAFTIVYNIYKYILHINPYARLQGLVNHITIMQMLNKVAEHFDGHQVSLHQLASHVDMKTPSLQRHENCLVCRSLTKQK